MAEAATTIRQNTLSFTWSQMLSSHESGCLGMSALSLGTVVKHFISMRHRNLKNEQLSSACCCQDSFWE